MNRQYHILNGDLLKDRFFENIKGDFIVAREALADGNVEGKSLAEFFKTRADFISSNYDGITYQYYFEKSVSEFEKVQNIQNYADVNLWFEDDLFCQVNLWFVCSLLSKYAKDCRFFLIRPQYLSIDGFGGLSDAELISMYANRSPITEIDMLAKLWEAYQGGNTDELRALALKLESDYPFILAAVAAHEDRIPSDGNRGRPSETLLQIMDELNTAAFEPIFKKFAEREPLYGFGDLQIKRLLDEIKRNR